MSVTTSKVKEKIKTKENLLKVELAKKHLKLTRQREIILEAFLKNDHISAEDLYHQIAREKIHLGVATIYRTLNLLCELGIGQQRHFGDQQVLYDNILNKKHHDHLICQKCKKIVEFESPDIEKLQEKIAKKNGFVLKKHRLELYGECQNCVRAKKPEVF